jgi:hypothetical protein
MLLLQYRIPIIHFPPFFGLTLTVIPVPFFYALMLDGVIPAPLLLVAAPSICAPLAYIVFPSA